MTFLMIMLSLWVLRALIAQALADLRNMVAQEVHPTAPPPTDPFVQRPAPQTNPPERDHQGGRAQPEPGPRDTANEQNESDFPAVEPPPQANYTRPRRGERPAVVHSTREELSELTARITQTVVEQLQKPMAISKHGRKLHIKPC
eukprot:1800539-Alexandrium_andersonii.AAC.1